MANPTMTLIASNTVGSGGVASVTFSSIPATYTDLILKSSSRDTTTSVSAQINIQFNGDTAANYERLRTIQAGGHGFSGIHIRRPRSSAVGRND